MRHDLTVALAILASVTIAAAADDAPTTAAWDNLSPHFEPPKDLAADFGGYESPLSKPEGGEVTSAAEWPARRLQILRKWRMRLGDWPPPLEKPELRIVKSEHRENFTQHQVVVQVGPIPTRSVPFAEKDKPLESHGYLLVPDGEGPFPAVFVPFYEPLTSAGLKPDLKGHHDYGYQLAKRGYLTLSIGTPGGNEAGSDTREALVRLGRNYGCQPLGFLAYVAANCHTLLAQREDVDPKRIGLVGLSYGGKWSMFGSLLDERYACAVWGDPGIDFDESNSNINYYEPWYIGYDLNREMNKQRPRGKPDETKPRTGLYKEMIDRKQNLVDFQALMAPRPVLVSGGTEDKVERWKALNHLIKLNKILGHEKRVGLTLRATHVPDELAAEQTYQFFDVFLKPKREEVKGSAVEPARPDEVMVTISRDSVQEAVRKGLNIATKGARNYPKNRDCFSCHHQTLPLLAMMAAHETPRDTKEGVKPFVLDWDLRNSIGQFTVKTFEKKKDDLRKGEGIGGRALTVGYALWTLELAGYERDETTDAMVEYLLETQEEDGHWNYHSFRPPASSSTAMTTALAVNGIKRFNRVFAEDARRKEVLQRAAQWFCQEQIDRRIKMAAGPVEPQTHEDRFGHLWGRYLLKDRIREVESALVAKAANFDLKESGDLSSYDSRYANSRQAAWLTGKLHSEQLRNLQHADGGWSQEAGMASDAYATAQSLWIVSQTEDRYFRKTRQPVDAYVRRGIAYLLNTQQPDGSWHVKTRAKPVQVYFDNGDPHGKDQFLSMMATSWATTVLAQYRNRGDTPLSDPKTDPKSADRRN